MNSVYQNQQYGLQTQYCNDPVFALELKKLVALAFVPIEKYKQLLPSKAINMFCQNTTLYSLLFRRLVNSSIHLKTYPTLVHTLAAVIEHVRIIMRILLTPGTVIRPIKLVVKHFF
ncbi:hypothetical protein QTP88_008445 [Uroleucon formosanum]